MNFEMPTIDSFPGCCTSNVFNDFLTDENIEEHFNDEVYSAKNAYERSKYNGSTVATLVLPKLAAMKAEYTEELVKYLERTMREDTHTKLWWITLGSHQSLSQTAVLKAGFKKVGTYPGDEGVITVFQKGLRIPRRALVRRTR